MSAATVNFADKKRLDELQHGEVNDLRDAINAHAADLDALRSAPNVPTYAAGTTYNVGFTVGYKAPAGRPSFYRSLKAGLLPAPSVLGDSNWLLIPGPSEPTARSQRTSLAEAQGAEGAGVQEGLLYIITGRIADGVGNTWNQDGTERTIAVLGYENWFGRLGVLLDSDQRPTEEVDVNVGAGTYAKRVIGGGPSGDSYTKAEVDARIQAVAAGEYCEIKAGFSPGYSDTLYIYPTGNELGVYNSQVINNINQVSFYIQRSGSPGFGVSSLPLTLFAGDTLQVNIVRNQLTLSASVTLRKQP